MVVTVKNNTKDLFKYRSGNIVYHQFMMGTPSILVLKSYLRTGQTRLSIISCTVVTLLFDFPASSLDIDMLIVSGITETIQTVSALARLSLIPLRKNIRFAIQLLKVP